jgi:hypothetical protein
MVSLYRTWDRTSAACTCSRDGWVRDRSPLQTGVIYVAAQVAGAELD